MTESLVHTIPFQELIRPEQWRVYDPLLELLERERLPFALGGAFALAVYTGHLRDTKDLDLYVLPQDRPRFERATAVCGLADYFSVLAYDRSWIYRTYSGETIVDVIWAFANHVSEVDLTWFQTAPKAYFGRHLVSVIPPEELLRAKLYVMQRGRCDWPDLLNLLFACAEGLNWSALLDRLGDDLPLFAGLLNVFAWVAPGRAARLPEMVRQRTGLRPGPAAEEWSPWRVRLLDSRPWFAANSEQQGGA